MKLVRRQAWGAALPRCTTPLPATAAQGLAVHYSGAGADAQDDHPSCAARVRAIQRFHQSPSPDDPTKPWCDIAYNHLFCRHGYVFEGRGFGLRSAAQGTHEGNDRYFAVCFLGNDRARRDDLTAAGRQALSELVAAYRSRYPRATGLRPHSDFVATACPGDELRALIVRIR
ncbi:MAG: N-acetylmuramoyl-L-alanine amidase [Actinomycetota bacterium]|nr:N-acetylmuramoyl-L-alanine amidase [Actinomycetota bacterium]